MDLSSLVQLLAPALPALLAVKDAAVDEGKKQIAKQIVSRGGEDLQKLWQKLQPQIEANPDARLAAAQVAQKPDSESRSGVLQEDLERILSDSTLRDEISALLQNLQPLVGEIQDGSIGSIGNRGHQEFVAGDVRGNQIKADTVNIYYAAAVETPWEESVRELESGKLAPATSPSPQDRELETTGSPIPDRAIANPFGDLGRITDPQRFWDREELMRQVFEAMAQGTSLSLVGESQIGKSSILAMICRWGPERLGLPVEAFQYVNLETVRDEADMYMELYDCLGFSSPPPNLRRALKGKRYVLCLDEVEKMVHREDFSWKIRSELRGLAQNGGLPLTLVVASRSPLKDLFPDNPHETSPLGSICRPMRVKPFTPAVARKFIVVRLTGTGVSFTDRQLDALWEESQGHPQRLQAAAAELFEQLRG